MEHKLKCWPEHYAAIERGAKTCELRLNDRPYQVGDALLLKEYEPLTPDYTGRQLRVRVTHIVNGGPWLAPGYIAMSIRLMADDNAKQVDEDWKLVADRQRDELAQLLVDHSAADREVGHLTGERDELKRQLAELSQLVGAETQIAAFTLAQTWYAEKAAYQEEIADLQARWDVLTEQYTQEALRRSQVEQDRRALCDALSADSSTVAGQTLVEALKAVIAERDDARELAASETKAWGLMKAAWERSEGGIAELQAHWERAQTALRNARIYVDRMTIRVGPIAHDELWQAKRALQLIDAVLEEQADASM